MPYGQQVPHRVLFARAGDLKPAYEAVDWSATSVGDPATWPASLLRALQTVLDTRFPALLCWGDDLTMLYNDAYAAMVADKHPGALGRPVRAVFPEAWDAIEPLFAQARAGHATWVEDMPLMLERRGFLEECWFTFSYSPVMDDDGGLAGILDLSTETTNQVLDRRRLELLTRLGDLATELESREDFPDRALEVLATDPADMPLAELHLPGARREHRLPPPPDDLGARDAVVAEGPDGRTAWLRIPGVRASESVGVLAVRLSPHLAVDAAYLGFLRLVASSLGDALSVAGSYEAERRRADQQAEHAQRLRGLVEVAQTLPDAEDEEEVLGVLAAKAADLVHSDGVVLGLVDPAGGAPLRVLGDREDPSVPLLERALDGVAQFTADERGGAAARPLRVADRLVGALGLSWRGQRTVSVEERDVLSALAASTAQALDRVRARRAEREAAEAVRSLAETLQRSLLTAAPQPGHLQIAVRYLPAAEHAQVGGDWHDAFLTATGTTCLVIGDVTGHDQEAAAAMGQVRNLLRGIGYSLEVSPAAAFTALDRAMRDLGVGALATAVLATVEQVADGSTWRLRWSNAGHPPPVVLLPGEDGGPGRAELLRTDPDLLLGLDAECSRADHVHGLPAGATVLLYTDGLVERRGASVDDGLAWLRRTAGELAHLAPDEVCDRLLDLVAGAAEDDIAVLAVRVREPGVPLA
ncbi:SpoIIE family protein phosphatase [Kineococcus terrestris]|uniref:SpoIIE family protein phosphatase n=1 Tax=Kineococcus terrestris TaxID=2044856 RepID=UPI0034DB63D9